MSTASEILSAALALNLQQRSEIAHHLLLSLESDDSDDEIEKAWADEIRRRRQAIREGRTTLRDWDEALASLRASVVPKASA
jgi:hypothetical protein